MKLDPKEVEKSVPESATIDRPVYPYGLSVGLDDEALKKLGLSALPKVGTQLYLGANVEVVGVNESEYQNEGGAKRTHRHVQLQITDLGLDKAEAEESDAGGKLYGD